LQQEFFKKTINRRLPLALVFLLGAFLLALEKKSGDRQPRCQRV
jgi:hypothetical protein